MGTSDAFAYQTAPTVSQPPQAAQQSPEQLQQLVAPIALYPDGLVAQILPAATYPDQVVDAGRWMQAHGDLKGDQLAKEVDKQPWDASVKALTQFPAVLANMNQNLAWTSELGDAYVNQQQELNQAIQTMRQRAKQAGNLQTTNQQTVTSKDKTIVIQPAAPDVVYVPQYDPWLVYGGPLAVFPGWYPYPGLFLDGPGMGLGLGFGIGFFAGFGWGWNHWGFDWHGGRALYNHNTYISHSRTIVNRNGFGPWRGYEIQLFPGTVQLWRIPRRWRWIPRRWLPRWWTEITMKRKIMNTINLPIRKRSERVRLTTAPFAIFALFATLGTYPGLAQQSAQPTFPSAAEASQSLFGAVERSDEEAIAKILGGPSELTSSKDAGQDKVDRQLFVQKYQEMHRLGREPDGAVTLYIGAENWPFPIPLVEKGGSWRFDADGGLKEVLYRRIGENEVAAIAMCQEFVTAEKRYSVEPNFAKVEDSSPTSLVAKAATGSTGGDPVLLHGYYYRLLVKRPVGGSNAGGKPDGRFLLIAYPAEYRSSGVMTFIVTEKGVVYEKDLGANTKGLASAMGSFHKDASWRAADE
jgi:hypothetical protein